MHVELAKLEVGNAGAASSSLEAGEHVGCDVRGDHVADAAGGGERRLTDAAREVEQCHVRRERFDDPHPDVAMLILVPVSPLLPARCRAHATTLRKARCVAISDSCKPVRAIMQM